MNILVQIFIKKCWGNLACSLDLLFTPLVKECLGVPLPVTITMVHLSQTYGEFQFRLKENACKSKEKEKENTPDTYGGLFLPKKNI